MQFLGIKEHIINSPLVNNIPFQITLVSEIFPYTLVSSAKQIRLEFEMSLLMSAIVIKNSKGPSTVPCGTPLSTGWSD